MLSQSFLSDGVSAETLRPHHYGHTNSLFVLSLVFSFCGTNWLGDTVGMYVDDGETVDFESVCAAVGDRLLVSSKLASLSDADRALIAAYVLRSICVKNIAPSLPA